MSSNIAASVIAELKKDFGKWAHVVHWQEDKVIKSLHAVDKARAAELEAADKNLQDLKTMHEDEMKVKAEYIKELETRLRTGNLHDADKSGMSEDINEALDKLSDCQSALNDAEDALCEAQEQLLEADHDMNELKAENKRLRKDRNIAIKAYMSECHLRFQQAQLATPSAASASSSTGFKRSNEFLGDEYLPIASRISRVSRVA